MIRLQNNGDIMKPMKLTKNIISRKEAKKLAPDYVGFVDEFKNISEILEVFGKLKKGQTVLVYNDGRYVICKVSSINHDDFRAIDGPIVRVGNGEYTWRVDGDRYAYPIKAKKYLT